MSKDLERIVEVLAGEGGYRISQLERAHRFHYLLKTESPSFYRYLKDAMRGRKPEQTPLNDEGVEVSERFELGFEACYELMTTDNGIDFSYVGKAFDLSVEGRTMNGNASYAKYHLTGTVPNRQRELLWEFVTNETWPTMSAPFIKRGKSLGAENHTKQLLDLAVEQELNISSARIEEVFSPIAARLFKIYRAIKA